MKTISLLILLTSTSIYAQDFGAIGNDYGDLEVELAKCSREACLEIDGSEYGFYEELDRDGNSFLRLNTESSLMDMSLDRACFKGDKLEVLEIVEALAGNTNEYYAQGGHIEVVGIFGKLLTDSKITIETTFITDYDQAPLKISSSFKKCE